MNFLVKLYKRIKLVYYNKSHGSHINSIYASLDALYGVGVRVDKDTRIAREVSIGDYSYVNTGSSLENCDVGKFCSISSGVHISPYNHNLGGITTHPVGDYKRSRERTKIGNDVLISLNAIIMEGVHIGDGAVIGAGAVVTHDVGKYEIWGGSPARFIHYRVSDERQRETLAEIKWWDMDDENRNHYLNEYSMSLDGIEKDDSFKGR